LRKLNVFFTDSEFIFVEKARGLKRLKEYGTAKIPEGYIQNGIIKRPKELAILVEDVLKRTRITSSKVNLLLHEKIILFKKFPLPEDLKNRDVHSYLRSRLSIDLVLPFDDPVMDVKIETVDDEKFAYIYAASENVLNSYISILLKAGLAVVNTDVPALAAHRAYYMTSKGVKEFEPQVMFVNVYKTMLSISIFDYEFMNFSIVSDIPLTYAKNDPDEFAQRIQDEIYRMNNYYVWNVNKGDIELTKAVIAPITGDDKLDEYLVRSMVTENQTNIQHLVFYNPHDEERMYDIYIKYLFAMSYSLM